MKKMILKRAMAFVLALCMLFTMFSFPENAQAAEVMLDETTENMLSQEEYQEDMEGDTYADTNEIEEEEALNTCCK